MGEYATRKIDNENVKIGTESSMYYLRHDQKKQIIYHYFKEGKVNFFRLFFSDEKGVLPGDFEIYNRSIRLKNTKQFFSEELINSLKPGNVQVIDDSKRITLLVPCYHGLKENKDIGKVKIQSDTDDLFLLTKIKELESGFLTFNIECSHCGKNFWLDLEEIPLLETYFGGSTEEKDLKANIEYVLKYNEKLTLERELTNVR